MTATPLIGHTVRVGNRIGVVFDIENDDEDGTPDVDRYVVASSDGIWDAYLDELIPVTSRNPLRCRNASTASTRRHRPALRRGGGVAPVVAGVKGTPNKLSALAVAAALMRKLLRLTSGVP